MGSHHDFDAMAEACMQAGRLAKEHGSPALRQAMRVVLFVLGREIAARQRGADRLTTREAIARLTDKQAD